MNVIGYAWEGDIYCPDCAYDMGITHEEECNPMFSSDEVLQNEYCSACKDEIAILDVADEDED